MTTGKELGRPVEILLVEDSPSDAGLTMTALEKATVSNKVTHVEDGVDAISLLRNEGVYADAVRPDVILLDINLPRKNGMEVMQDLCEDASLKLIPVIVLTTSDNEEDVSQAYGLNARAYICKPVGLEDFIEAMRSFDSFWLTFVALPNRRVS
jgi:chemotaxis family two-component system response regulator Rcp1